MKEILKEKLSSLEESKLKEYFSSLSNDEYDELRRGYFEYSDMLTSFIDALESHKGDKEVAAYLKKLKKIRNDKTANELSRFL